MPESDHPSQPKEHHERRLRFATPIRRWLAWGAVAGALLGAVFALTSDLGDKARLAIDLTVLLLLVALILRRHAKPMSVFLGASAGWAAASLAGLILRALMG